MDLRALLLVSLAGPVLAQVELAVLVPSSAQPGDKTGSAVDLDGARALVGASQLTSAPGAGRAAVWLETSAGWALEADLWLPDGQPQDAFGFSVALDRNWALIGAPYRDGVHEDEGRAYLFERTAAGWERRGELRSPDPEKKDQFGLRVALEGDLALVSAPDEDGVLVNTGAVHVFERGPAGWAHVERLSPPGLPSNMAFGWALDLDGERFAAGGIAFNNGNEEGRAYLYQRDVAGWRLMQEFLAPVNMSGSDLFGSAVAISGDTLAIGAMYYDTPPGVAGLVWIYDLHGSSWDESAVLAPFETTGGTHFGRGIGLDGDLLAISSQRAGLPQESSGATYLFRRTPGGWSPAGKALGSHPSWLDGHGMACVVEGDRVLAGAPKVFSPKGLTGYAYFYDTSPALRITCNCAGAPCGFADTGFGGCVNSTGLGAVLGGAGTTSLTQDDLVLEAFQLPAGQRGLFLLGQTLGSALPFGDGQLCVAGPSGAFPLQPTGASGRFALGPGLLEAARARFGFPFAPGQSWTVQALFRDPAGCGGGTNTTQALTFTLTP